MKKQVWLGVFQIKTKLLSRMYQLEIILQLLRFFDSLWRRNSKRTQEVSAQNLVSFIVFEFERIYPKEKKNI